MRTAFNALGRASSRLLGASLLLLFTSAALAQPQAPSVFTASPAELRQYVERKYPVKGVYVSPKQHHLWGPTRDLSIEGALTPPSVAGLSATSLKDARVIAQAFFNEEARLLGLTAISEMREEIRPVEPTDQSGSRHLKYHHYIGGSRLEGTGTVIHMRADGQIFLVMAGIAPVSPSLLQAVTQPTLSDPQARLVIKRDLEAASIDPRTVKHLELEKVAIAVPPYVLWTASVGGDGRRFLLSCRYTMDAFNGQILERLPMIQSLRPLSPDDRVGCPPTAGQ